MNPQLRRIGFALLIAAIVWALVYGLELVVGITPGVGRWVGAGAAFIAVLWTSRRKP